MLDKLKQMANLMGAQKVIQQVNPILCEHLQKMTTFKAQQIQDDAFFDQTIAHPAWQAIQARLGTVARLYPGIESKFFNVMRNLRQELMEIKENGEISLVPDYENRLSDIALSGVGWC